MNIEAYNLDSLRKLVRNLQNENKRLRERLEKANIPYDSENIFTEKIENMEEYDLNQGGRILDKYITREMANQYFSMFCGRTDVYARRGAKGGYFPQCNHRWDDQICPKQHSERLNCEDVITSEQAKYSKPRKEIFLYALERTGWKAEEVIHVGDSLEGDVKCPGEAGIRSIWLNRKAKPVPENVVSAENFSEVLKILDEAMTEK